MSDMKLRDALAALLAQVDTGKAIGNVDLDAAAEMARRALAGTRRHEFFVVIAGTEIGKRFAEQHPDHTFDDRGPMVLETYVNGATRAHAETLAKRLEGEYGWTRVGRVIVEDWPEVSK